ncbi:MAG: hypothetical protein ACOX3H_06670 [Saccharofermentanales bacterium]|jgi:hypothetical protein
MKKALALLIALITILSVGCGSKNNDFNTIFDRMKETSDDFKEYETILEDFNGGQYVKDGSDKEQESLLGTISLVEVNNLYASVEYSSYPMPGGKRNSIRLTYTIEDNNKNSIDELEEEIGKQLKEAFPKIKREKIIRDGEISIEYDLTIDDMRILAVSWEDLDFLTLVIGHNIK